MALTAQEQQELQEIDQELGQRQGLEAGEQTELAGIESQLQERARQEQISQVGDVEAGLRTLGQGFTGLIGVRQPEATAALTGFLSEPPFIGDPQERERIQQETLRTEEEKLQASEARVGLVNEIAIKAIPQSIGLAASAVLKVPALARLAAQGGLLKAAETPADQRTILTASEGALETAIIGRSLGLAGSALTAKLASNAAKAAQKGSPQTARDIASLALRSKAVGATAKDLVPKRGGTPLTNAVKRLENKKFFQFGELQFDPNTGNFTKIGRSPIAPSQSDLLTRSREGIKLANQQVTDVLDVADDALREVGVSKFKFNELADAVNLQEKIAIVAETSADLTRTRAGQKIFNQFKSQIGDGKSLKQLQQMKQQLGKELTDKDFGAQNATFVKEVKADIYGILKRTIEQKTDDALAGMKPGQTTLSKQLGAVKDLNATESALIKVSGALEQALGKESARRFPSFISLGGLARLGTATFATGGNIGLGIPLAGALELAATPRGLQTIAAGVDFAKRATKNLPSFTTWLSKRFPNISQNITQQVSSGEIQIGDAINLVAKSPIILQQFKKDKESFSIDDAFGTITDPTEKREKVMEIIEEPEDSIKAAKMVNTIVTGKSLLAP